MAAPRCLSRETISKSDSGARLHGEYRPRYNIASGDSLEIITNETPAEITRYKWGLVPYWSDESDDGFINARSETAHEKPAFRSAWSHRPCLVLSSGFYEWRAWNGGPKQPYRIYRKDAAAFALAGLWEEWHDESGDTTLRTVTILTTNSSDAIESIHERMPVVPPRDDERMNERG